MLCTPTRNTYELPTTKRQIARLLDSLCETVFEDAAVAKAAFDLMDRLDEQAREKREPAGLTVRYGVDLDGDRFGVMRASDPPEADDAHVPAGHVEVYFRINQYLGTNEWIGPVMISRPMKACVTDTCETALAVETAAPQEPVLKHELSDPPCDERRTVISGQMAQPAIARTFPPRGSIGSIARAEVQLPFSATNLLSAAAVHAGLYPLPRPRAGTYYSGASPP